MKNTSFDSDRLMQLIHYFIHKTFNPIDFDGHEDLNADHSIIEKVHNVVYHKRVHKKTNLEKTKMEQLPSVKIKHNQVVLYDTLIYTNHSKCILFLINLIDLLSQIIQTLSTTYNKRMNR